MKNRFFTILISVLLVISMLLTFAFSASCKRKPGDDSTGSTGTADVPPDPPVPDPDTAEDRSAYTYQNALQNSYDVYLKDIVGDKNSALSTALKGYLLGDFYSLVINKMQGAIEGKLPAGIKLDAIGLSVYRGIDGNWYRPIRTNKKDPKTDAYVTENIEVNACLNGILNYKLDSDEKLSINFSLYGEKSLGEILLDYTPSATDTDYSRNWMIGIAIKSSPEVAGVMNMTLNELRTLLSDTAKKAEKEDVIVKRFGDVQLGASVLTGIATLEKQIASGEQNIVTDIIVAILKQIRTNKFVTATAAITVKQYYEIKNAATDQERYGMLSTVYKGVLLGDVFGLDDTMTGYISEIHTMSLSGIFNAMAKGTLNEYVFRNIRGLTIDKVIEAYLREDETALANYKKIYNQYQRFFDLSVKDFVDAFDNIKDTTITFKDKVLQAMYDAVKGVPVVGNMKVEGVVEGIKAGIVPKTDTAPDSFDVLQSLNYFDQNFADDLATVSVTETVNLSQLLKGVISSFVADKDGNYAFDFDKLTNYLETTFEGNLDGASQTIAGMNYAELKAMIQKWIGSGENGGVDYYVMAGDVVKIIYNKVLVPNGITEEALLTRLNSLLGGVITSDTCAIIVTKAVEEITGLSGAELDTAFNAEAGTTFTAVIEKMNADLNAGSISATTAVYNFVKIYGKTVLSLASGNKSDFSAKIKTIVENNTSVDANGNKTVNYTGVACDLYAEYRSELIAYVKKAVASEINGNKYGELTFDYDIVEFLYFKALDDNLAGLKAGTVTRAQVENAYIKNATKFMSDYIKAMAGTQEDKVLYTFTDSKGNVFDITVKEISAVMDEVLKARTGDGSADVKGALQNLLGDAKVCTLIELIDSLGNKQTPQPSQLLAA